MDRRRQKTRKAIFEAFLALLERKRYDHITVQEILDRADVGRSTFYAHFETKEMLLEALCREIYFHMFGEHAAEENLFGDKFCAWTGDDRDLEGRLTHILWHVRDNRNNLATLLRSEGGEIFMGYFKGHLKSLFDAYPQSFPTDLPRDLLLQLLATGFAEILKWWAAEQFRESPEAVAAYFLGAFGRASQHGGGA